MTFLLNTQADISPERRQPQSDDRPTHVAHFTAAFYTLVQELALPAQSLGFPNPLMCPIFADGLQWILNCSSGERRASRPVPPLLWDIAPGQTG